MREEVSFIRLQQKGNLYKRIACMENRVSDLEQNKRINYVINGLDIKLWSYAHTGAVGNGEK